MISFRLLLVAALLPLSLVAQPSVTVEKDRVIVAGVSPLAQTAIFGVARESYRNTAERLQRYDALVADSDGDGRIEYSPGRAIAPLSVWIAVDLASGAAAVGAPEGFTLRASSFPTTFGTLLPDQASIEADFVDVLYVQPLLGAWGWSGGDGGESDLDPAHLQLGMRLPSMIPIGPSPAPPAEFLPGSVMVIVHPRTLRYSITTLSP